MNAKRIIKRIVLVGLAVMTLLIGMRVYSAFSTLNAGDQIDVGGRNVFILCKGTGSPTVILEHGLGASGADWAEVQDALSTTNRVCYVSRAGMGFSDPASGTRTASDAVDDLEIALLKAEVKGPYVMVGHSFGGLVVRLYADRNPEAVVGVVLVDSTHEDQIIEMREALTQGTWREVEPLFLAGNPEQMDVEASGTEVRSVGNLGSIPLIVLEAAQSSVDAGGSGLSADAVTELESVMGTLWPVLQKDLAGLSTNGRHVVVDDASHFVHLDQPEVVVDWIKKILGDV